MSRSVAVSFSSLLLTERRTFEMIGIVFRRSTTLATWPSALERAGFSMVSRMVDRYPRFALFRCARGLAEDLWLRSGLGKGMIRREELPVELDAIEQILQERAGRLLGRAKPPTAPSP